MQLQLKLLEQRKSERKRLTGLLPGRLKVDGKDLSCRPVDVSRQGLGLLTASEIAEGSLAELHMKDQVISLQVTWRQRDFGKKDLWRYGLVCQSDSIDLEQLFVDSGCLK